MEQPMRPYIYAAYAREIKGEIERATEQADLIHANDVLYRMERWAYAQADYRAIDLCDRLEVRYFKKQACFVA